MKTPSLSDQLRPIAYQAMALGLQCKPEERSGLVRLEDPELVVTLVVSPRRQEMNYHLTDCEKHILAVLQSARCPWTGVVILAELDKRGLIYGDSTLRHALAHLVHLGRIQASRKAPRGYTLVNPACWA